MLKIGTFLPDPGVAVLPFTLTPCSALLTTTHTHPQVCLCIQFSWHQSHSEDTQATNNEVQERTLLLSLPSRIQPQVCIFLSFFFPPWSLNWKRCHLRRIRAHSLFQHTDNVQNLCLLTLAFSSNTTITGNNRLSEFRCFSCNFSQVFPLHDFR